MNFFVLSYVPGMFGEFVADLIQHAGLNFYNKLESVSVPYSNRVLYPNYLAPIGKDFKNHTDDTFVLTAGELTVLAQKYGESNVCVPTHWYHPRVNTNLPCVAVRLYSKNLRYINLAYCMAWIKSHTTAELSIERKLQLEKFINDNHQHASELKIAMSKSNFKNWQYLAVTNNLLQNGKFDLPYYIKGRYLLHFKYCIDARHAPTGWNFIDAGTMIHGDMSNIPNLESIIQGTFNRDNIRLYANRNLELLKNKTGLSLDSLSSHDWLDVLTDYCVSAM